MTSTFHSRGCSVWSHLCTLALIVVPVSADHPVTRRDESDITAVELAALHRELAVDPLRWFSAFATDEHWYYSDAVYQQLQGGIQIWCTGIQELARQIQSYVDANNDPDNVSWSDSRFYMGSRRAGDSPAQHFQRITFGRCSFVTMSRTIVRSLEVLALLLFFVVTTPHSRCSVANVCGISWLPSVVC